MIASYYRLGRSSHWRGFSFSVLQLSSALDDHHQVIHNRRRLLRKWAPLGSLFTAITIFAPLSSRCWNAPETPKAMQSFGFTVLPEVPTWRSADSQPASTAAREAQIFAFISLANSSTTGRFFSSLRPRPTSIRISDWVISTHSFRPRYNRQIYDTRCLARAENQPFRRARGGGCGDSKADSRTSQTGFSRFAETPALPCQALSWRCAICEPRLHDYIDRIGNKGQLFLHG